VLKHLVEWGNFLEIRSKAQKVRFHKASTIAVLSYGRDNSLFGHTRVYYRCRDSDGSACAGGKTRSGSE
jgi:hypothetical protein